MPYLHGFKPLILLYQLLLELLHLLLDPVCMLLRVKLSLGIQFLNVRPRLQLLVLKPVLQLLALELLRLQLATNLVESRMCSSKFCVLLFDNGANLQESRLVIRDHTLSLSHLLYHFRLLRPLSLIFVLELLDNE